MTTTTIDDLPDDILDQILQNIPLNLRKKTRCELMLVSRKWKDLADNSLGLEVFIGTPPWSGWEESVEGASHVELSKIGEIGISHCHVGEIMQLDDTRPKTNGGLVNWIWTKVKDIFSSTPFLTFKHPHLLKLFRFSGVIRNDYFHSLLSTNTTHKLHQIQFNHSALSLVDSESLENLNLDSLHYLEVMADFSYIFRDIDDSKILSNILTLLGNSFPLLTAANLYIPFSQERELEITKTFFNFLLANSAHLKFVEIFYFYMLNEDDELELDQDNQNEIQSDELDKMCLLVSQNLQLKVFIAHINVDTMRCFHYWHRLLQQQRTLEYLVVLSEHQIFSEALIQLTAQTIRIVLGTVDTRDNLGQAIPLNCAMFSQCPRLLHLSLNGRYEDYVLLSNTPGLINAGSLPHSLRHLDLSKLSVLSIDLERILLGLPNLRHFVGKFLGRTRRMGITLDILNAVVERRQLTCIHFTASFNGNFPEDGISNGHPSRPTLLLMNDDCFCAKLGRNGYYVMASPFDEVNILTTIR